MSFDFQKSPLQFFPKKGWALSQKKPGGELLNAWVCLPGSLAIEHAVGADASALLGKAEKAGLPAVELPPEWIALPTGMDLQVHLRHPGQPQKETLEGGLESALYGGFDTVVTMPNTNPFLDSREALEKAIADAAKITARYPLRVAFTASATMGMQGQNVAPIAELAAAGAVAITDDGWGVKSAEAQEQVFAACSEANILFQQHAEMPGHKGVATRSAFQRSHQLPEYPRSAESEMVKRDIELLRKQKGARYHVLHVSTRETLAEIRKAKNDGLPVTAEVTPHHLHFCNEDIPPESNPLSTAFKFNPPIFDLEDRAALRAALRDGTIDCVSTDHAPHEVELKRKGWLLAPFGTRGLETALPALLSLVHSGDLSLSRLVEVFSTVPRKILGRREYSKPTGLLFVNPKSIFSVKEEDLPGISRNSCFLGKELHGRIELRCEINGLYTRALEGDILKS